ncbi:RNA-guided endonuclease TnpB family protein [Sporolactobacillus laevolacticus]|uniref:RNA-guided endonuclease TnpB family protein n=1 Tax=Sporolactobacillus laevolacticus TaxID=33018 RepID=UPI0025B56BFF|nr:RNA-guided endonuclease TnpB family protein [Sporolactobacillus laevolacticus]MDN3955100.1 RNA-guided endonuclease TnpB family protein [Sporolactobacillus laevolacticus]
MPLKGLKIRIYPNKTQKVKIKMNFGYNRFVWNQMLNLLIERYKNNPKSPFLNAYALNNLLPALKTEYTWLKDAESTSLQATNHDLITAYKKFFNEHNGFPKFKSKKFLKQSYQSKCVNKNIKQVGAKYIKLPKLGILCFKSGRPIPDKIRSVTIKQSFTGKYYAVLLVECENQAFEKTNMQVGLDMGVRGLLICSDGTKFPTIRFDKRLAQRKHYWEKRLARRRLQAQKEIAWDKHNKVLHPRVLSDFANYRKAKVMVAKYNEKIANQRNNYLHHLTTKLVKQYDVIAIEDLKTKNLLHNHKLARAIANQAWRELRRMLSYKCEWYGKQLIVVNPYKTSQICSHCGHDNGKHPLEVREWTCSSCHHHHDRDFNAAKNILKIGLGQALVKELSPLLLRLWTKKQVCNVPRSSVL